MYLNRIPSCLIVAGYVDDTTIVGDASTDYGWIKEVLTSYAKWRNAGIHIDMHSCWKLEICLQMDLTFNTLLSFTENPLEVQWITEAGHPSFSALAYLLPRPVPHVVISRSEHFVIVQWHLFVKMHSKGSFLLQQLAAFDCKRRSKLAVLTKHKLTTAMSIKLDSTMIGMQTLTDRTQSLGL